MFNTTMKMMDAAKWFIENVGDKFDHAKTESLGLSVAVKEANPGVPFQALNTICQNTIDKVKTLL